MHQEAENPAAGPEGIWEKNLAALKSRPEGLDLLPTLPPENPRFAKVTLVAGEHPSLQVISDEGRPVTLHSPRRAWEEARELARAAPVNSSYLVALGLGLGYQLLSLLPSLNEDQHLIVVEKEPEVMWAALAALDLTPLLSRPRTVLVVIPEASEVARHLREGLLRTNGDRLAFWGHPPSLRSHKAFYQEVAARLRPAGSGAPARPVGLKKDVLKVLLINPDYFLIAEVMRGFRHMGHEVRLALFDKRRDQGEEVLRQLLAQIRDFSPDLVFTVNHLGFDRQGLLLNTLHRLRVPSVSWYVDSPAIILSLYDGPQSDLAFIFVWDPTYIPEVRSLGFERVFPLPLATDPGVFSPERARGGQPQEVAFVGNSMVGSVQAKLARLPKTKDFQEVFVRLCRTLQTHPFRSLENLLKSEGLASDPAILGLDREGLSDLEAALLWKSTLDYRLACVKELAPFQPAIYGDPGWRELVGLGFRLHPEVNYYDELPRVFGATAINFNATSLQMKAAVNQRVFDAPAAGGFLLTDFREQLAELFDVKEEVVCFADKGEIPELVRFYLGNPNIRRQMTAKARRRVLAEHTYGCRVATMLDTMRRTL